MTGGDLLSRVIVPLLCGAVGGGAVSLLSGGEAAAPATEVAAVVAPRETGQECAGIREELAALSRSFDELKRERGRPSATALGVDGGAAVQQVMIELEKQRADFQARVAENQARREERNRSRALTELAELKTIHKNTPAEQTEKNVVMWIRKLGFSPEDQQRVAIASVGYVRQRTEVIISLVEQASQGRAPSADDSARQLAALEASFASTLPGTLDPEARKAVIGSINARVRLPHYLQNQGTR